MRIDDLRINGGPNEWMSETRIGDITQSNCAALKFDTNYQRG